MRRATWIVAVLLFLAYVPASRAVADNLPVVHLLVKLRRPVPDQVLATYRVTNWSPLGVPGWVRLSLTPQRAGVVRAQMARDPNVLVVEQDRQLGIALTPDDTYWEWQWGMTIVNAPQAWDVTTGRADVVIAILDTGADLSHPDLVGQFWVNEDEIPGNALDDDHNGKVDDINGWRFCHLGSTPVESNDVQDDHGHGTHVAGIVAARGNNALGVAGIAWGCRLMIVKVLDRNGDGWYSDLAAGLIYATDNGARIVNLSLGGPSDMQVLRDAVDYARSRGVLIVAAAGNIVGSSHSVLYPAAYEYERVLAIAATDESDRRAGFSCYGPQVDLAAPGSLIYSTCLGGGYCYKSGTSMATPLVSGLAALLWSLHPGYTPEQVRERLIDTALDIESTGWDQYTGWGRVDAGEAIRVDDVHRLYLPLVVHHARSWYWPQSGYALPSPLAPMSVR